MRHTENLLLHVLYTCILTYHTLFNIDYFYLNRLYTSKWTTSYERVITQVIHKVHLHVHYYHCVTYVYMQYNKYTTFSIRIISLKLIQVILNKIEVYDYFTCSLDMTTCNILFCSVTSLDYSWMTDLFMNLFWYSNYDCSSIMYIQW